MTRGVFVGLSTIDVVYGVDRFPADNTKIVARSQDVFVGGPAANAAVAFAHLGGRPMLVTTVGRHPLANMVREELLSHAVQLFDLSPEFDGVPAISSVSVDAAGNRNVTSANETRMKTPHAEANREACEQADVVMVDGHSMQACLAWAAAARACGTPVVLDGGSWKEGTSELLASVDIAICSSDFCPPGCGTEDDVFNYLKARGVAMAAMTRGAEPVRFACDSSTGTVQVPQVRVVDTMGAGDIFHGAFCHFAGQGLDFVAALEKAAAVAADSCRFRGPRAWMKPAGKVQPA